MKLIYDREEALLKKEKIWKEIEEGKKEVEEKK